MPKYLFHGSYTLDGVRGLVKVGGSDRKKHIEQIVMNLGGRLEAFYFAFGGEDVYSIAELPDNVSSAALSLAISSSGGFKLNTMVLITPEEMDAAARKSSSIGYIPPPGGIKAV